MYAGLSLEQKVDLLLHAFYGDTNNKTKEKAKDNWYGEEEAAALFGLKPRTLRQKVKSGEIPVNFRATGGRNYQYNIKDILKYKQETSTNV